MKHLISIKRLLLNRTLYFLRGLAISILISLPALAQPASATVTYFDNDISGSPMVATDTTGNVVWKESHKPYGEKLRNEPASRDGKNKIGFAGSPFDASTGLSYMGARYYDPVIGRFMGVDPVGFQEGNVHSFNRYAYANNNPYKFVDRDGRTAISVLGVGIALIGGASYALAPPNKQQEMRESAGRLFRAIGNALHSEASESKPTGSKTEPKKGASKPSLLDPKDATHVLDGDADGGGHAHGTGKPGKSEFPSGWSRDKILGEISDVATDPNSSRKPGREGTTVVVGTRDGVGIRVIIGGDGSIVTGYPTGGEGVTQNPR